MDLRELCSLPPDDRPRALASAATGLALDEVRRRLARYGRNELEPAVTRSRLRALVGNLTHPLALLLWFGAAMADAAHAPALALAIVSVVVINGVFAFLQESRAERVIEALLARAAVFARVVRAGELHTVPASELVPGDVLRLAAGDVVAADCVLIQADALSLDLSLLTGETTPIHRSAEPADRALATDVAQLACIVPAGAGVLTGRAEAVVAATGRDSSIGKVAALLTRTRRGGSLLERQVAELSRLTAAIAVLCGTVTLALATYVRDTGIVAGLTFATGVIVALVPEGLLPLLTVALAMGARRMASRGALVRRLSAIEVVGATTVICTDKTGTLTQNALEVLGCLPSRVVPDAARRARLVAALCNDAQDAGDGRDPIDRTLAAWVAREGVDLARVRAQYVRTSDLPFDPHRRYMRVNCTFPDGERQLIKGAPEAVAALLGQPVPRELTAAIAEATTRGERVLLLADGPASERPACVGLVRLHDPPRPEVPAAVAACRRARIRVVMITGDHPGTAREVGRLIGLTDEHTVVFEGHVLDTIDDRTLLEHLRGTAILARTTPEQKVRVVRVLQGAGEVVTVTGDGVNDAPALRTADVGIAMGRRGTEVAKQASDIVLLDENFATIVAAIDEGRALKHNIRRFVSYVFTSNVAELVPFLCYIFLPIPLPLTILQVLAIDLGTDLIPALALGLERSSSRTLQVSPEAPRSPLLTRALAIRTFLFYGVIEAALGMAAFLAVFWTHGWRPLDAFGPYAAAHLEAGTLTFLGIVGGQIGCLFAQRDGSLRVRLSLRSNPWIALGVGFELVLALVLVYVPGVNATLSMVAVAPAWLLVLPIAAAIMIGADHLRRRARSGRGQALARDRGMTNDTLKDKIEHVADKAKDVAEKVGHAVKDAAGKVADVTQKVAGKVADKIQGAGDKTEEKLGG